MKDRLAKLGTLAIDAKDKVTKSFDHAWDEYSKWFDQAEAAFEKQKKVIVPFSLLVTAVTWWLGIDTINTMKAQIKDLRTHQANSDFNQALFAVQLDEKLFYEEAKLYTVCTGILPKDVDCEKFTYYTTLAIRYLAHVDRETLNWKQGTGGK